MMPAAVEPHGERLALVLVEATFYWKNTGKNETALSASQKEEKRKTLNESIMERIPKHVELGEFHVLASIADGFGMAHLSEITKNEAERAMLPAAMNAIRAHVEKCHSLPLESTRRDWHIEKLGEIACWERLPREAREKAAEKLVELKAWSEARAKLALAPRRTDEHRFHLKRIGAASKASAIIANVGKAAIF